MDRASTAGLLARTAYATSEYPGTPCLHPVWPVELLPIDPEHAWSLLSREPAANFDLGRWQHQARTFFDARLDAAAPLIGEAISRSAHARFELDVGSAIDPRNTRVELVTLPLGEAPFVWAGARAALEAIGGAGFEVLVQRATRLWQVKASVPEGGDKRAPLVLAAIAASVLLAPLMPPGERTLFGVKGARMRLDGLGWPRPVHGAT